MPLRLANQYTTPPGGFKFWVEATKVWIPSSGSYPDKSALRGELNRHLKLHNLPLIQDDEIENQLCKSLPDGWCEDVETRRPYVTGKTIMPSLGQIAAVTRVLVNHALNGRKIVSGQQAESRASICAACKENNDIGCSGCSMKGVRALIELLVGGATTTKDNLLKGCRICECFLKPKVWIERDVIWSSMSDQKRGQFKERAPHCWILKEMEQK